jgi:putative ABC transport system ATP-binding protein
MKLLLKAAFQNRKHYILMLITLAFMLSLTVSSQLEMFAMGVITKSGPDFFSLFAPEADGKLKPKDHVTKEDVEARWNLIDAGKSGTISRDDAAAYMAEHKDTNLLNQVMQKLDAFLGISKSYTLLAVMLIFVAIFRATSLFGSRYFTKLVSIRVSRDLRLKYFEHMQLLPMSFYQQHNIGSLSSRVVADASVVASAINFVLVNYLQTPFTVISTLVLCFYVSWELSMIIFLGLPLVIIPIIVLAGRIKRISKKMLKNQEGFSSVLIDFLAGIQTVKMFAMEDLSLKKYKQQNTQMAVLEEKSARYGSMARPVLHTIGGVFLASVIMYGTMVAHMTLSDLIVYCGLLYIFYEPIKRFSEDNAEIQRGVAAAERMFEVLHLRPNIEDKPGAIELQGSVEIVEFENVWFKYENEWVLKGISFTAQKGQTVAIVGPTGSGKSTIVQLLPRLYDVDQGEVRINGKSVQEFTQKSLREHISFVPQKPFLFMDTVKENIAFGRPFSTEDVEDAAKRAFADEFICRLPQQYDTLLAETGKNLSGGQMQRLAIARALVKKAPILIMDEATSALDSVSEKRIKDALEALKGNVIQILIAHRLTTIQDADKILYIENGIKLAEGTKDELLQTCPNFRLMWEMMRQSDEVIKTFPKETSLFDHLQGEEVLT